MTMSGGWSALAPGAMGHAADLVGQMRLDARELGVGEPELVVGHDAPPISGGIAPHMPTQRNPLYGS